MLTSLKIEHYRGIKASKLVLGSTTVLFEIGLLEANE